jgi:hypothetical protein
MTLQQQIDDIDFQLGIKNKKISELKAQLDAEMHIVADMYTEKKQLVRQKDAEEQQKLNY